MLTNSRSNRKSAGNPGIVNVNAFAGRVGAVAAFVMATGRVVVAGTQAAPENTLTVEPAVSTVFATRAGRESEAVQADAAAVFVSLPQLAEITPSEVGRRDEVAELSAPATVEHCPLPPMSPRTL